MPMDKKQKTAGSVFNAVLAISFLAVILLPWLSQQIPFEPRLSLEEQRRLTDRPKLEWTLPGLLRYPGAFDSYTKDHFGLRTSLVHSFNRIRRGVPGLIVGNKVLVGRDGWYFITENKTLDDFRGITRLSPADLEKIRGVLEERREWLGMFGIKYLLAIAPAKWEVYPEKVPGIHNRVSDRTVLDQIAAYLKDTGGLDLLDLREPLREMKRSYRVYSRTDTHWNDIGLFIAVQEIKKRLSGWFSGISLDSLENYSVKKETGYSGDLARMMGLAGKIQEEKYGLAAKDGEALLPQDPALENALGQTLAFEEPDGFPRKPRAVIFHDSFGISFPSHLKDSFERSVYSWRSFLYPRLIIRERPEVVVQELAERDIMRTLSRNLPGIAGPGSVLTGKRAQWHCPTTHSLTGFKARALSDLPVRQFVALLCNGKKIFEWPLETEERDCAVPEYSSPPDRDLLIYSFAYRYAPSFSSNPKGGRALPFDLRAECGGGRGFVGINGGEFNLSRGINIYMIGGDGRISQVRRFESSKPGGQDSAMAGFIERVKRKKGFLLLIDGHPSGRAPSHGAQAALHSLGLRGYARDGRPWNHIALVDLGSRKVIAERSGRAPQTLVVGDFKAKAGFRIRSLRVTQDAD